MRDAPDALHSSNQHRLDGCRREGAANTTRSKVRARVEHVFGQQQSSMGGKIVRTIGIARARFKIASAGA
jgi:hypothetical protein